MSGRLVSPSCNGKRKMVNNDAWYDQVLHVSQIEQYPPTPSSRAWARIAWWNPDWSELVAQRALPLRKREESCPLCSSLEKIKLKIAMMSGWSEWGEGGRNDVLTWQASMLWVINLTMLENELTIGGIWIHDTFKFCSILKSHHSVARLSLAWSSWKTKTVQWLRNIDAPD